MQPDEALPDPAVPVTDAARSSAPTPFMRFNRLKPCRYGPMLYNPNDIYIGRSLDLYGEFSEGEVDLFRQVIPSGAVVVEVGANIGTHTVFLAQHVGPTGLVLAFEPQRLIFQTLCANLALNSVPNVVALNQAVGTEPGTILVPVLDPQQVSNFGGLALEGHPRGDPVVVVPLDQVPLRRCHFLKIDVEGMEEAVLRGAVNLLARSKPLLYVENDRSEKAGSLIRLLIGLDYLLYWHRPPLFNPRNFLGNPTNVFEGLGSWNMLGIHRSLPQDIRSLTPVVTPATVS